MTPRLVLAVPVAFALFTAPAGEELVYGAEEDLELVRTYAWVTELELEEFDLTINGEELPEEFRSEMEMTSSREETYVARDVYGPSGDGRPESLVRTFESLEGADVTAGTGMDGEDLAEEEELSNALEGRTVVFVWDEDEEEFGVEFDDDGEDDEELLEELVEDMDLRGFLPDEEVEEGDSWALDVLTFEHLAGGLEVRAEDDPRDDEFHEQAADNMDGEAEATFTGVREEDGVRVAAIWITAELETWTEQTEDMEGTEVQTEMTHAIDYEGELLWNLDGGHLHGLELEGQLTMTQSLTGQEEMGGESFEIVQHMTFTGESTLSVRVERE
jgi:hypothetical protein